jgi:chromosome segregation ATPase
VGVNPAIVNIVKNKASELDNVGNDLGAMAMERCVAMDGKLTGMLEVLNVVLHNYKVEAINARQDVETELSSEINKLNNEIIELNNNIHDIETNLIPEKIQEKKDYEVQLESLMNNNSSYDFSESLSSDRILIVQLAVARTKELIRKLKQKVVQLKTDIDQKKLAIDGLEQQKQNINFYNEAALRRRMGIFFNHWLIALVGLDATDDFIEKTKSAYNQYMEEQVRLIHEAA